MEGNTPKCVPEPVISCANVKCSAGLVCMMQGSLPECVDPCVTAKCGSREICKIVNNQPKCIDPCATVTCPNDMECTLKVVQCARAPCYPQPSCVPKPYLGCTVYKDSVCHQNASCVDVRNQTKSVCQCPKGTVGDAKRTIPESGKKYVGCYDPKCPDGQVEVDFQCFSFPKDPETPDKAEKKCELQGGHLLALATDAQWEMMKNELVKAGQTKPVLIGYTDADMEGQFVWADNTAFYEKWAPNEPSTVDSQKKDCVVIEPAKGFKFVTVPCNGKYAYACSQDLNPYRPCPPGWKYDYEKAGEDCYFEKPDKESFYDSYMTCIEHGADLPKITSKEDEDKLMATFTMPEDVKMWLGVRRNTKGSWGWLLGDGWSEATYTNWARDEPKAGNECVVVGRNMKWYSMNCKSGTAMVKCEKGQKEDKTCPEGSQRFGEYCFHSGKDPEGGGEASSTCVQRGAKLITIRNEEEQKFIADFLSSQFPGKAFWIGLTENNATDGAYTWSDGSVLGAASYESWGSSQPDDKTPANCVGLDPSDSYNWNDADCTEKKYPLCHYRNQACVAEGECHKIAECKLGQCRCRDGYEGDGKKRCIDVDECEDEKLNNCHEDANCTNTGGSFECTCKEGFEGDGVKCIDERICSDDSKCSSKGKCPISETGGERKCVCNPGFEGNGVNCKDTNECTPTPALPAGPCHASATCENTEGSFECKCKNGFSGDGGVGEGKTGCKKIPMNCEELRLAKAKPDEKEDPKEEDRYTIDPDGTGDLEPVKVKCIMRPEDPIGITVIDHDKENPNTVPPNKDGPHEYKSGFRYMIDILKIFAIIENSKYCYQEMWHKCNTGHDFLAKNNTLWKDGKGNFHNSWSGALTEGKCVCGELSACRDPSSSCNCDGKQEGSAEDGGFLTKKEFLPVTDVWSGGIKNGKSTRWKVGPLKCGPKPFDIPKDCHEAKFKLGMKTNRILLIDVDGPNGDTEPFYVNCDMTTYPHTGVTMLPHDNGHGPTGNPNKPKGKTVPGEPQEPTSPDDIPLVYPATPKQIKKLIERSQFCSQYVEFECKNHPITSDTEWYDIDGNKVAYFPGGNAQKQCACGVVGRCEDNKQCDCDIADGKTRRDFGLLTKRGPLPVGKLKFKKAGQGAAKGKFSVDMLKCGQAQFGIPPTCQEARQKTDKTYAYLIDPDGKGEVLVPDTTNAPFTVFCKMVKKPPVGVTIVGHPDDDTPKGPSPGPETDIPVYHDATLKQIKGLTKIVAYCKQRISIDCQKFKLHEGASQLVYWKDVNDKDKYYFSGTTGNSCADNKCNCDTRSDSWVNDSGFLMDKDQLPVTKVVVENLGAASPENGGARIKYKLEAMECYSLYPTCYHLQQSYPSYDDFKIRDGYYVIDADGAESVEPFRVYCDFPITQVKPNPQNRDEEKVNSKDDEAEAVGDKTKCVDIMYKEADYTQLKALTEVSGFCKQFAVYWGWNAPFTDHMHWEYTADGENWVKQPGWAGSLGAPQCACGPIKGCNNGRDKSCDNDVESGKWESDHGEFIDKSVLPVGRFCHNYKDNAKGRWSQHRVYQLECSNKQFHIPESCQELRDWKYWTYGYLQSLNAGFPGRTPWLIDPDTEKSDALKPFIVLCDFVHDPPIGITIINHNDDDCEDIKSTEVTKTFTYLEATKAQIVGLTKVSTFCTQNVRYECSNDKLALEKNKYGWWDRDNKWADHWSENNHGVSCTGADCKCQGTGNHVDGLMLMDKNVLPVSKVVAKATSGTRKLCVESLVCYSLYRNCHEILTANDHWNPLRNNIYAIDPDRAKLRRPFAVTCDFTTDKGYGITIVNHDSQTTTFKPKTNGMMDITYPATKDLPAPHLTIQGLAQVSGYCSQELRYKCTKAALLGNLGTYFSDFGGKHSSLWAGADSSGAQDTCGCGLFNTCPTPGAKCRCDGLNTSPRSGDGGLVWNRDMLPVKSVHVRGLGSGSKVEFLLGPMRCSPRPFSLPKDCQAVLNMGYGTGENLIWPKKSLPPFVVTCDMDIKTKLGVTIFVPKTKENSIPSSGIVPVDYREATLEQVLALVKISKFCLHPIKYKCRSSNMFANSNKGRFSFKTANNKVRRNFAYGGDGKCGCGKDRRCSGPGSPKDINDRVCNCDSGDNVTRLDAGSFSNEGDFPIKEFNFGSGSYDFSLLTLGNLHCARGPFDYDECSEFNDCDRNAECINHDPDFVCRCKKGWQAKGTSDSATGRQCPDDDECNMDPPLCPQDKATCINTPGDFICNCHAGYNQTGKTTCDDIDECAKKTHNCDKNANCFNTIGSFKCFCKSGFRGSGIEGDCEEIGRCACYGDPHCSSFDQKKLHFQGACTYTMARDRCSEGGEPNYEVAQKSWRMGYIQSPVVSWVKDAYIKIGMEQRYEIMLIWKKRAIVNGELVTLPFSVSNLTTVNGVDMSYTLELEGSELVARFANRLEVRWSGLTRVDVIVPKEFKTKTCGLCGNFNNDEADDWTIGPACKDAGQLTTNNNKFGNSWRIDDDHYMPCKGDCDPDPTPDCTGANRVFAQAKCAELNNPNGKFKPCFDMFPTFGESYYSACVYDVCRAPDKAEISVCAGAEFLVEECYWAYWITIENWRRPGFCGVKCNEGMEYKSCGNHCATKTCTSINPSNPSNSSSPPCIDKCKEGCYCKAGLVMDGDKCIKPEKCGCEENGRYFSAGETYVRPNCTESCVCDSKTRKLVCDKMNCHKDASCGIKDWRKDCYCNEGFEGNGKDCDDINECTNSTHPVCDKNAKCDNTYGSYNCTCKEGFEGEGRGAESCDDIDECKLKTHNCHKNAECKNIPGSFNCDCKEGYTGNGTQCDNIDECATNRNQCDKSSTICRDTDGSYVCDCKAGFSSRVNEFECKDDDECTDPTYKNDCHKDADCINLPGTFSCTCKEGYEGDGVNCTDKDECKDEKDNSCDPNAQCTNSIGSYGCKCNEGYRGDGFNCEDINECIESAAPCGANSQCTNIPSSYTCACEEGYTNTTDDHKNCKDINECFDAKKACGDDSQCTNVPGTYTCACDEGYTSATNDGKNCKDIDECEDPKNSPKCDIRQSKGVSHGHCVNTPGGYECECDPGFEDAKGDGSYCKDIDECTKIPDTCGDENAECKNTPGYFECICKDGYWDNGAFCEDVDECAEDIDECDTKADCENVDGSYYCTCQDGYKSAGNGGREGDCKEVDQCKDNLIGCSRRQECIRKGPLDYSCKCKEQFEPKPNGQPGCRKPNPCKNMTNTPCFDVTEFCIPKGKGKYDCGCKEGFKKNPSSTSPNDRCEDENECLEGTHLCHKLADCHNTFGGHNCSCRKGYVGDGQNCKDDNECKKTPVPCKGPKARCINKHGSFECRCGKGYKLVGDTCKDLDECKKNRHDCRESAECKNTEGGFECNCKKPTDLKDKDGKGCHPPDDCSEDPNICISSKKCVLKNGKKRCECKDGYKPVGITCKDIDECLESGTPPCNGPNQFCVNKVPGFECKCEDGYKMVNGRCKDIDECKKNNPKACGTNATCDNTEGSFECSCQFGFMLLPDKSCKDIDECRNKEEAGCDNLADCINTPGSYVCKCREGYSGNGKRCNNINECNENKHQCHEKAVCKDTVGSYTCTCIDGYTGDGRHCEDIDECDKNRDRHNCGAHAKCINLPGSFKCECEDGFSGHCDACRDIDECYEEKAQCSGYAECINYVGGFTCNCKKGLWGDGRTCNDFDECALGTHECGDQSFCENTFGSYRCVCNIGYKLVTDKFRGPKCLDLDECTESISGCNENAKCVNTVGSYKCECKAGFSGDGKECSPSNVRNCGDKTCHEMAMCEDGVCKCRRGFTGDGVSCIDIDECKVGLAFCDTEADCINTPGSYFCKCRFPFLGNGEICFPFWNPCQGGLACGNAAWCEPEKVGTFNKHNVFVPKCRCLDSNKELDSREFHCLDKDECQNPNYCGVNEECLDHTDGASCVCHLGFERVEGVCKEIDACKTEQHLCDPSQQCVFLGNGDGYICECGSGLIENPDTKTCELVPQCKKACGEGEMCKLFGRSKRESCVCKTGYVRAFPRGPCVDIDECQKSGTGECDKKNAKCVNTGGSYKCECKDGFLPINGMCLFEPCLDGSNNCGSGELCVPDDRQANSYRCECKQGYKRENDECVEDKLPDCNCGPNGACKKSIVGAAQGRCRCDKGYRTDPNAVKDICVDDNECDRPDACHALAICTNTPGSFKCECPKPNFEGDGYQYCDLNECLDKKNNVCHEKADCINTPGSYQCKCQEGYSGDGVKCEPEPDPCLINNGGCPANSYCVTKKMKAECICNAGYTGDGGNCVDVDECKRTGLLQHNCAPNSICKNDLGGYICDCMTGYEGNGRESCNDIDECSTGKHTCHFLANCENSVGSHKCTCKKGFKGDGIFCVPDAECKEVGGCGADASCIPKDDGFVCKCDEGYRGDGQTCKDIDECANEKDNNCHKNAKCINKKGGYECECKPGTVGDGKLMCRDKQECVEPDGKKCGPYAHCVDRYEDTAFCKCNKGAARVNGTGMCRPVDECADESLNECDKENAVCTDTITTYTCKCKDGFRGNGKLCSDIDECKEGSANCDKNALCINTPGRFTCKCLKGFLEGKKNCTDIDECEDPKTNICASDADCINKEGYYECKCKDGFIGNGEQCVKPSPCDATQKPCIKNEECSEEGGKAVCACKEGLEKDASGKCAPVNECTKGSADCDPNADCIDKYLGYECKCKKGFTGNGTKCDDINECDPSTPEGGGAECDSTGGECVNTPGGHVCTCDKGLKEGPDNSCGGEPLCSKDNGGCDTNAKCTDGQGRSVCECKEGFDGDAKKCTDVNECALDLDDCSGKRTCTNTEGGYTCDCAAGFKENPTTKECDDIDECAEKTDDCKGNSTCVNLQGEFACVCKPGFRGEPCEDIDECKEGTDPCSVYATCTNTVGYCTCDCKHGYKGDGIICEEEDECKVPSDCDTKTSFCKVVDGKDTCACKAGYTKVGDKCVDEDECTLKKDKCHPKASCTNKEPGYSCTCKDGYKGDGFNCVDIDECKENKDNCHTDASCKNLDGSFECACKKGFTGDGVNKCDNDNECDKPNKPCSPDAECKDKPGSYICKCKQGYRKDGKNCTQINECDEGTHDCDVLNGKCKDTPGSFDCQCKPGFTGDGKLCKDINECDTPTRCPPHSKCINGRGTFTCQCDRGYAQVGNICDDVNECDSSPCDPTAKCRNTQGSFRCTCRRGYRKTPSGECVDVNECLESTPCQGKCHNTPGSFECVCENGYKQAGIYCVDVNECDEGEPCRVGECMNQPGGYRCKCPSGFIEVRTKENNVLKSTCKDVDECIQTGPDPCGKDGTCRNTQGSFRCQCDKGFRFSSREGKCVDIDECKLPETSTRAAQCENGICINTEGSYMCDCLTGYAKVGGKCVDIDECKENPCDSAANCYNTDGSFYCICKENFTGDGRYCEDTNECSVTDTCPNPRGSTCINQIGGYKCNCKPGYVGDRCDPKDECTNVQCGQNAYCINQVGNHQCYCNPGSKDPNCSDVDECSTDKDNCDVNAECANTNPYFNCKCKYGFSGDGRNCKPKCRPSLCKKPKHCVLKDGVPSCVCSCTLEGCMAPGDVCGTDEQTYLSYREMVIKSCEAGKKVKVLHEGRCARTCNDIQCPERKECYYDELQRPGCRCPACNHADKISGEVCTKQGKTFKSKCDFNYHKCSKETDDEIDHDGPCTNTGRDCRVGEWTPWTSCPVTCGKGRQFRTRDITSPGPNCPPLKDTKYCYKDVCDNSPCANFTCSGLEQICDIKRDGAPDCFCPNCTEEEDEEVCAKLGPNKMTFTSMCKLRQASCRKQQEFILENEGQCKGEQPESPSSCRPMPRYVRYRLYYNGEKFLSLTVFKDDYCDGGCGKELGLCCRPYQPTVQYRISNFKGTSGRRIRFRFGYYYITKCKCNDERNDAQKQAAP